MRVGLRRASSGLFGTAFAGVRREMGGRLESGVWCGAALVGLGAWPGCANGAKRSAAPGWRGLSIT